MVKRILCVVLVLMLPLCALAEYEVTRLTGDAYFPDVNQWTYRFTYAYPQLVGEDLAAVTFNDTYQVALDEMLYLVVPMFANDKDMTFGGQQTIVHDFTVTCNNGAFVSILSTRSQTLGEDILYTLEGITFDVAGEYIGQPLTLRGVVKVADSTTQMVEALLPELYKEYLALAEQGVLIPDLAFEDFCEVCYPDADFYTDPDGNAVFFFQPSLMVTPGFDVPTFTYTPQELLELVG